MADENNPYSAPSSGLGVRITPIVPRLGHAFGRLLLTASLVFVLHILYLHSRFPGLYDATSKPVTYWPEIAEMVSGALAAITAFVGLPIFWQSRKALLMSVKTRN